MDTSLANTSQQLPELNSYEQYLAYYMQLEEASTAFSWLKAEALLRMEEKLGKGSTKIIAKDLGYPSSTITNYVRVARAFPPDKREPTASFSAHFQASFADKFSDTEKKFEGEKRFEWIQKAADDHLSTRQLADKIQEHRITEETGNTITAERSVDAQNKVERLKTRLSVLLRQALTGDNQAYQIINHWYNDYAPKTTRGSK